MFYHLFYPLHTTISGLNIAPVYADENLEGFIYKEKLGYPGEYPYTRGVQPNMYRGRLWTMRQYSGLTSPRESNKRYRYLLKKDKLASA